jgi:hypothetical protein
MSPIQSHKHDFTFACLSNQDEGADFFVLLGDDVELNSAGWKTEIESVFTKVAIERSLPFGVGCVAFRDEAFCVFPTFPVLHRTHLEIFGDLFPRYMCFCLPV